MFLKLFNKGNFKITNVDKMSSVRSKYFLGIHCLVVLSLMLINCKKNNQNNNNNNSSPPTVQADSVLNKNVYIIDSTKLILSSDTTSLNQGHLEYNVVGTPPSIKINDVIVGVTNGGYIRKVTSINRQQNKIIIESTQGTMEDVFNNAGFNFTTGMDGLNESREMSEHSFDISGKILYQNGPIAIKLDKGLINVGGDWNFDFDFKDSKLENFLLECKNASFNEQFDFNVTADQAFNLVDTTITLKRVAKYYTKFVTVGFIPVPIVVYMEVELRGKLSASIESKVDETFSMNSNTTMDLGLSYSNAEWKTIYNKTSSSSVAVTKFNDNLKAKLELGLIPYVSFRLYRIAGPYASFGLKELVKGGVTLPAGDWDFYAGAWLQTVVGARAGIFSKSWVDYNKEWNTDTIYYQTPDKIEKSSGDNQTGTANQFLAQPLKVRVLDYKGSGQSKVPVYFTVTAGGGSVETTSILTDKDGYAQTRWKIGDQNVIQTVEAKVKRSDGSLINGSPVEFGASVNSTTTTGDSTFVDPRDGQVYTFRHIGTQIWMTKNLNYAAAESWCYDNSSTNCDVYGRLYKWSTVLTVAPPGWHVPSVAEWNTLVNYLGGDSVAGGKMKDTTLWNPPNTGANNSSGFAGLPAGMHHGNGLSYGIRDGTWWWSSTEDDPTYQSVWICCLVYNESKVYVFSSTYVYDFGHSVRCIKD